LPACNRSRAASWGCKNVELGGDTKSGDHLAETGSAERRTALRCEDRLANLTAIQLGTNLIKPG
jgi:hypothetical protein